MNLWEMDATQRNVRLGCVCTSPRRGILSTKCYKKCLALALTVSIVTSSDRKGAKQSRETDWWAEASA